MNPKYLIVLAVVLTFPAFSLENKTETNLVYGAPWNEPAKVLSFSELQKQKEALLNQEFAVAGTVQQVCQKKGCWMKIGATEAPGNPNDPEIRVTFKDYKFFVPKTLNHKMVFLQGKLIQRESSESEQKHYLKDANASSDEIAKIKEPKLVYEFVASSVKVQ